MNDEDVVTSKAMPTPSHQDLCALGQLVESMMAHEVNLVGQRMSGLVLTESILFGSFVAVLASKSALDLSTGRGLLVGFPIVGIVLAVLGWVSILAAGLCMRELSITRVQISAALKKRFGVKMPALGPNRTRRIKYTVMMGNLSVHAVPALIVVIWAAAIWLRIQIHVGGP